jgi:hypothetical protein
MIKFLFGVALGSWLTLGLIAIWQHFPDWAQFLIIIPAFLALIAGMVFITAND